MYYWVSRSQIYGVVMVFWAKKSLRDRIKHHFGVDPTDLPILTQEFASYNHVNVQLALDAFFAEKKGTQEMVGWQGGISVFSFKNSTLSELVAAKSIATYFGFGGAKTAPVRYTTFTLDGGKVVSCVEKALYFHKSQTEKLVIVLRADDSSFGMGENKVTLEVMAADKEKAEAFMEDIRSKLTNHNVYRGKILSLDGKENGININFQALPDVPREKIILPNGLLERIERQTIEVSKYSKAMLEAGRKLKRGVLLHGPPGTGKTMTAMYLAKAMQERTVIMLTGRGLGLLERASEIARWLQPSMIIIEDIDLIAEDRTNQSCNTPLLFELLNQMDGLSDDCDVLFLLTTNRPDILEPALASRPGRIDQAYEIGLPDTECRKRLFDLYSQGLVVKMDDMEKYIRQTKGASGAFINELLRKSALFAAPEGSPIAIEERHMDEAMHELIFVGGLMTKKLLGFSLSDPVESSR